MGNEDSNKKDPVATLDEIIHRFDDLHKQTITEAQRLGQARQICLELRPAWQTITGVASNSPDAQTLVNTNTALMEAYRNEVFEVAEEIGHSHHKMRQITLGVDSLVQATGATYSFIQPNYFLIDGSALRAEISHEEYADRLSRIDPSLGKHTDRSGKYCWVRGRIQSELPYTLFGKRSIIFFQCSHPTTRYESLNSGNLRKVKTLIKCPGGSEYSTRQKNTFVTPHAQRH